MQHPTATREEWLAARNALMIKEKARTRLGDAIAAERRALPWVRIEKEYGFDSQAGKVTLHTVQYSLDSALDALHDLDAGKVRGRAILVP